MNNIMVNNKTFLSKFIFKLNKIMVNNNVFHSIFILIMIDFVVNNNISLCNNRICGVVFLSSKPLFEHYWWWNISNQKAKLAAICGVCEFAKQVTSLALVTTLTTIGIILT